MRDKAELDSRLETRQEEPGGPDVPPDLAGPDPRIEVTEREGETFVEVDLW